MVSLCHGTTSHCNGCVAFKKAEEKEEEKWINNKSIINSKHFLVLYWEIQAVVQFTSTLQAQLTTMKLCLHFPVQNGKTAKYYLNNINDMEVTKTLMNALQICVVGWIARAL